MSLGDLGRGRDFGCSGSVSLSDFGRVVVVGGSCLCRCRRGFGRQVREVEHLLDLCASGADGHACKCPSLLTDDGDSTARKTHAMPWAIATVPKKYLRTVVSPANRLKTKMVTSDPRAKDCWRIAR